MEIVFVGFAEEADPCLFQLFRVGDCAVVCVFRTGDEFQIKILDSGGNFRSGRKFGVERNFIFPGYIMFEDEGDFLVIDPDTLFESG